jgi:ABC-type dipeptide/oligopeptide/nickel transport system permease component
VKNRTNCVLLGGFVLSFALWSGLFLGYFEVIEFDLPLWLDTRRGWLALFLCAVPPFCFQLLLCRAVKRRWLPALPTCVAVGAALFTARQCLVSSQWDSLGWAVLMITSCLQVLGCALAWVVFALSQKRRELPAAEEPHPAQAE